MVNNPPFALSSEFQNGNLANPGGGAAAPLAPWVSMDALDPGLEIPRVWNWSVSYQRELGWGLFGEVSYIGNKGQNLLRQPDINQPHAARPTRPTPPAPTTRRTTSGRTRATRPSACA